MSETTGKHSSEITAATEADAEIAALPMVESPAISPATVSEPSQPVAVETGEMAAPLPSATARFRAAAAAQIEAARARLEKRNASAMIAVALLAGLTGALSSVGLASFSKPADQNLVQMRSVEDALAKIEDELAALRGNVARTAQLNAAQADKTGERFERIEKAQAEPAARLSKLSEIVEKLRSANAAAAVAYAGDITGSVQQPAVPTPMAKPKPVQPQIVEGWTLRELDRDVALVEGKRGLFEIVVGDSIPGLGRVEGFRKQDGRWVVVTAKGLIVPH